MDWLILYDTPGISVYRCESRVWHNGRVHLEKREIEVKGALQISDLDSFDLVQRKLLSGAVVKLSRPGRFVIGDGLGGARGSRRSAGMW